ncbi:MAG: 16S rRNA (uracil(1498)-N(3))-methyltransferase [Candidatus Alkaliphilus sp. MAG34]|nr:16S rRNA (uracil(1498)-N(3))-methyltransferase [Clostridiales bacterium]
MHRFFVDTRYIDFVQKQIVIKNEDVRHISKVLRLREGDMVEICDGANMEYVCKIQSIQKDNIILSIIEKKQSIREPPVEVVLYQGIPKGNKMELIIQKTVELGVTEILPVEMKRTVIRFSDNKDKQNKVQRWQKIALEASKQCKRGIIPAVYPPVSFGEALTHSKKNQLNIMPYEDENQNGFKAVVKSLDRNNINKIGIWIGPEGGLDEKEVATAMENGVYVITLGPRILRTETAGFAMLSLVMYELGDL